MNYPLQSKHPLALVTANLLFGAFFSLEFLLINVVILVLLTCLKLVGPRACVVSFGAIVIGFLSMQLRRHDFVRHQQKLLKSDYIQALVSECESNSQGKKYNLKLIGLRNNQHWQLSTLYELRFRTKDSMRIKTGDIILIKSAEIQLPENPKYPIDFNAVTYSLGEKRLGTVLSNSPNIYTIKHVKNVAYYVACFRDRLVKIVKPWLHGSAWYWYEGLILGDKSGISALDKQRFQQAGLMHVLSVSGMHLGLIYWLLSWPLKRVINRYKRLNFLELILLPVLWFYASLTGMAPPVFRAAIFITVFLVLKVATKRHVRLADLLLSAASLQVVLDPLVLYSISYQLSFAAMLGIGFVFPIWQDWWQTKINKYNYWGDLLGMSLSCTLTTLPITLYYFHAIPTWFLLGNLLFTAPFTLLIYAYVGFSLLVFTPFGILSDALAVCLNTFVVWLQLALKLFQNLPLSYLFAYDFGILDVCLFIGIILWYWRVYQQQRYRIYGFYIRIFVFLWMIWGYFRVYSFSWETQSGHNVSINKLQSLCRFSQSQNIDTIYLKSVNYQQP